MIDYDKIRAKKFEIFEAKNKLLKKITDSKKMLKKDVEKYNSLTKIYKRLVKELRKAP